jgi:hypothetical protein
VTLRVLAATAVIAGAVLGAFAVYDGSDRFSPSATITIENQTETCAVAPDYDLTDRRACLRKSGWGKAAGLAIVIGGLGLAAAIMLPGFRGTARNPATPLPPKSESPTPPGDEYYLACTDCGGELTLADETCPHCGATIEKD